ncbi:unnamed protein product [Rotaria sp. Silwood1]|nr:unnamed protein product [Rotaria sp. Silwood1]
MHTSQKFSQLFTSANEQQKKKDDPTRRNPTVSYSELNLRQLIGFDIDKVPQYLNHTNDSFQKIIHSIRPTMTVNRLEELRHIAILMYKLFLLEKLELLWTMYRRSGTGNLELSTPIEQMNRNIWPKEVRTRIELIHNKHISNNDLYLTFVQHCLGKLYEKNEECQRQLRYRTGHLVDYTWAMEETIKKFVQQGFMYQSVEYACQIALVQYNYREAMAKQQFLHENPNQNQIKLFKYLSTLKYQEAITRHQFTTLKQDIIQDLKPISFRHQLIQKFPNIGSFMHTTLQTKFTQQLINTTETTTVNMLKLSLEISEGQMRHYQKQYNMGMDELWRKQKILTSNERFTPAMLHFMGERLAYIDARLECIYNLKRQLCKIKQKY